MYLYYTYQYGRVYSCTVRYYYSTCLNRMETPRGLAGLTQNPPIFSFDFGSDIRYGLEGLWRIVQYI